MVVVSSMLVRSNRIQSMWGSVYLAISLLVLSISFLISFNLSADPAFQFHTLDKQQGLVSSVVYDIAQDKDGFMWFATEDGLQKYDGFEFTSYRHSRLDKNSISNNLVRSLLVDSKGRVWIGTSKGLNLYQEGGNSFLRYPNSDKQQDSNRWNKVFDIFETRDGVIWIGSAGGLSYLNEEKGEFVNFHHAKVRTIYEDKYKQLWIGTLGEGLYIFERSLNRFIQINNFASEQETPENFAEENIIDIMEDSFGRILVATWGDGVFKIAQGTRELEKYELDLPSPLVKSIHQDEQGQLWFGTQKGILLVDSLGDKSRIILADDENLNSPNSDNIFKIFQSKDKMVWIGTYGGGISHHNPASRRFQSFGPSKDKSLGLVDPVVFSMSENSDGNIWIGSETGKLTLFNPKLQKFLQYPVYFNDSTFDGHIIAILQINSTNLLIGSQRGLFKYDLQRQLISPFLNEEGTHILEGEEVTFILKDSRDKIWVGFVSSGIKRFRISDELRENPVEELHVDILSPQIMMEREQDSFFIGTRGDGVHALSLTTDGISISRVPNTENFNVLDLELDSQKRLWIATWSEGIKIMQNNGEFHSLDEDTGLPNNTVYSILSDSASKKMWSTSNVGMVAIDPISFKVERYGFYDGLQGDEFNRPGFISKNGFMYFGGINGFNRFFPNIIENKISIRKPIITEILVANKKFSSNQKERSTQSATSDSQEEIELDYSQTPFSIEYTSPQFIKPSDIEFRYRLVGLDNRWVVSDGSSRRATYTNISAGEYSFELQVRNINEGWNEQTVTKRIVIQPPWWLTTLARIVYLLTIVSILSFMFFLNWKRRQSDHKTHLLREKSEERLRLSLWGGGNEIWDWDIKTGEISRSDEDSSINIKSQSISEGLAELSSYIHKFDIDRVKAQLLDHLKGRTEYFESTYRIKDSELGWRWIQDRAKVVERDVNGSPVRMSGTQKDISEMQRKNEEIERLGQAFKNTSDGVWIRDSKWRLIEVNPSFEKITGFNFDEKQGEELWFPDVEGQSTNIIQRIRLSLMEKGHWQGEVWAERKKDEPFPQKLTIDTILDEKGHVNYYVGVFSDITFHKRAEEEFRKLANFDALTGLPNRACLYDRLNQTLDKTRIRKERFALFIVDIDNFKRINDSMGHTVGDMLIVEVAQRLTHCNRDGDTIARVGGDEFVIIRDDISSSNEVASFAESMLKELNSPIFAKGQKLSLNFSIGITLSPDDGTTAEKLLRNADTAMYEAKKEVQNSYHFFSVDLNKKARKRLSMENELRRAIEFDLIDLAYQPKVNMETGLVEGMEALARWNSPKLGQIPPDDFIVLAEETGQIISLGAQLLRKAVAQTKQWVDAGIMRGRTSVNMSAHQFLHADLAEQVEAILREEKLDAKYLELELTESACIQDMDKTIRQMNTLRKLGIHLALDDFGTGYSSLAQLKTLPLDTLKVDKSFIDNIQTSTQDVNVVKAIIDIARSLELEVVIEGVESQIQCDYLWQCRAKIIQGYFFSKPVGYKEMSKLLNKKWKRSSYLSKISDNVTSLG